MRNHSHCYQKDASKICFSAGYGDWIAVESIIDPGQITDVYWASRGQHDLIALTGLLPNWQHVQHHVVWEDWTDRNLHFAGLPALRTRLTNQAIVPDDTEDFGVTTLLVFVNRGDMAFRESSFATHKIADISNLDLPKDYVVIHAFTKNNRHVYGFLRDFSRRDWMKVYQRLDEWQLPGVVVGVGDDPVPNDPHLINLTNQTTLAQSLEVVKKATKYLGVDSCMSVMAGMVLPADNMNVLCKNPWVKNQSRKLYYPRHHFSDRFLKEIL